MSRISLLSAAQWLTALIPVLVVAGPAPLDIGTSLVAVLFLVHSAITRDASWLKVRWVQLALLLGLYMSLRNLLLPEFASALGRSASFLRYPLFAAALAFWVLRDERASRRTWWVLVVAVAFLVGDACWQYAFGKDLFGRAPQLIENGTMRLTGPYSAPRVGVTILWFIFAASMPLLLGRNLRWKLAGGVLLLAGGAAIFMSGERMALLLWLMGCGVCLLVQPMLRKGLLGVLVLGAGAAALLSMSNPQLLSRQYMETRTQVLAFDQSVYGRTWMAAAHIGQAHPLLGVGGRQFTPECRKADYGATDYENLIMRCPMHPHNAYLEIFAEYGGIGLLLLVALFGTIAWDALRARRQWLTHPLLLGLVITLALRLWPISVTPSYFISWVAIPLWAVIGWFYAQRFASERHGSH